MKIESPGPTIISEDLALENKGNLKVWSYLLQHLFETCCEEVILYNEDRRKGSDLHCRGIYNSIQQSENKKIVRKQEGKKRMLVAS